MKYLRWLLAIICVFLLMSIRVFETQLFYDPLLSFFKSDFYNLDFYEELEVFSPYGEDWPVPLWFIDAPPYSAMALSFSVTYSASAEKLLKTAKLHQ